MEVKKKEIENKKGKGKGMRKFTGKQTHKRIRINKVKLHVK